VVALDQCLRLGCEAEPLREVVIDLPVGLTSRE
jgi:hypothetical protein